ncbi:hypothetical protein [Leptolyngbya sp. KIOST-1]|uniref:hypothetical protein n=1 Tax=Leptolyngbya sp. KIOST-1 TaxID=1229172 RepID=UPI000AD48343|nr:hypothetical protein [Leptolyngbya sp. KIOST-1]
MPLSPYLALNRHLAVRGKKPLYVTGMDSATQGLQAAANYLTGEDVPAGGPVPQLAVALANLVGSLPNRLNDAVITGLGWFDASTPGALERVRAETMAQWAVNQYPQRQYPAVMIGSSNGAASHLCAALGIPWLPQTLLVCTRHSGDKDDPKQALTWAQDRVQRLLAANPDLAAYQMHDPNQDRLKVGQVAYFRLKRRRLGATYRQFLQQNLMPGGTLLLLECNYSWPATQVSDRHFFQVGGKGGIDRREYVEGSPRVADFLRRQGSAHRHWHSPPANGNWPEAEWGFEPALRDDVLAFAQAHGLRVQRIVFDDPQALSPLVADLHRWWYDQLGVPSDRLLAESFVYLHPWLCMRLGLVPYWTVFNDQTSLDLLRRDLNATRPYNDIFLTLFANGLNSLGIASLEQWRTEILSQARRQGQFLGVNERRFPRDNASLIQHYLDLKRLPGQFPIPEPLTLAQLEQFLAQAGDRYAVEWLR